VIDDVTKECPAVIADSSISWRRVARELYAVIAWRGGPALIISNPRTEFSSNAMLAWSQERRIHLMGWTAPAPGICVPNCGRCLTPAERSSPAMQVTTIGIDLVIRRGKLTPAKAGYRRPN
jgi:hypothetical protein